MKGVEKRRKPRGSMDNQSRLKPDWDPRREYLIKN